VDYKGVHSRYVLKGQHKQAPGARLRVDPLLFHRQSTDLSTEIALRLISGDVALLRQGVTASRRSNRDDLVTAGTSESRVRRRAAAQ